ncbi:MAG: DUF459 domain-containing protein, partial [Phyllobacteriaceae bacterium]|nr:DUF459 domain-containing protein [Phyllobacteriaceae bacterium]
MCRPRSAFAHAIFVCVIAVLVAAPVAATPAWATDPVTGFFNMLFGGGRRQAPVQIERIPTDQPNAQAPKRPTRPPDQPRIVETPKNPDAQTVLVLGDIEAAGLAGGLEMAFAEEPSLEVRTKVKNTTGLVRDGDADWIAQAPKILAEAEPDFVVTMIGINDWQTITPPGGKPLEPGSEDWNRVYGEHIDRYVAALKASGKPFWWVGLPPTADADLGPTRRAAFSAFLSSLNDLARPRVEAAGGTFVDVWAAFTDEEGHYTQMGPDVDGQVKRLRMNDGILFTRAGRRKLAFFVETGILKLKRGEAPIAVAPEEPKVQPKPEEEIVGAPPPLPAPPWAVAGPVV